MKWEQRLFVMHPPAAMIHQPIQACATKFVHTSTNKARCPVNVVRWTPEGRRLITGCSTGEFTLWNGMTFNFETILQAHDLAVRAMKWSHNDNWLVSADHGGVIKYWQSNMNNLKVFQGHREAIRDLSFSPTDSRFATASDDSTIKIWNFNEGIEDRTLTGHGWDVKCVDWHPYKSLLASGSKDNLVKLWDPKTGKVLTTLHGHKNTVQTLQWNRNGNWLATGARDQLVKVFDIRMMRELQVFRGHKKEICSMAWHPQHERLLVSGGSEGSLLYWQMGIDTPIAGLDTAHESFIWSLDWHPLGHILVSGSNDHMTRFWTRHRPGDIPRGNEEQKEAEAEAAAADFMEEHQDDMFVPGLTSVYGMDGMGVKIPGMGRGGHQFPMASRQEGGFQRLEEGGAGRGRGRGGGFPDQPPGGFRGGDASRNNVDLGAVARIHGFGGEKDEALPGLGSGMARSNFPMGGGASQLQPPFDIGGDSAGVRRRPFMQQPQQQQQQQQRNPHQPYQAKPDQNPMQFAENGRPPAHHPHHRPDPNQQQQPPFWGQQHGQGQSPSQYGHGNIPPRNFPPSQHQQQQAPQDPSHPFYQQQQQQRFSDPHNPQSPGYPRQRHPYPPPPQQFQHQQQQQQQQQHQQQQQQQQQGFQYDRWQR